MSDLIQKLFENSHIFSKDQLRKWSKPNSGKGKGGKGGKGGDPGDEKGGGGGSDDETSDENGGDDGDDGDLGGPGEDIDRHHKNVENAFGGEGNQGATPDENAKKGGKGGISSPSGSSGGRSHGLDGNFEVDYTQIKPTFNWKNLLSKMISSVSEEVEETYQKPNRRNASGAKILQQTGKSAIKPGEVPSEAKLKLCVVVDESGSMHHAVTTIFANLERLIKAHPNLSQVFYMIKFSNNHYAFELDLKSGKYTRIMDVVKHTKGTDSGKIKELFSDFLGSSTNFTNSLATEVKHLMSKHYNVLIITDTDILASGNIDELKALYKDNKNRIFMIYDSKNSFIAAAKAFGEVSKNFTYFQS